MPPKQESTYPKDWFNKGDADLRAAEVMLKSNELGIAGFHIQQAVEKYLKGYLISRNWKLKRIHDLEALKERCC